MHWDFFKGGKSKYAPAILLVGFAVLVSFLTRLILVISFEHRMGSSFLLVAESFFIGMLYDLMIALFVAVPLVLHICFTNEFIYTKKGRWVMAAFFAALLGIILFTHLIPKDFNRDLYKAFLIYLAVRVVIYLFLLTRSFSFRRKWRAAVVGLFLFVAIFLLLFNAVSEWFFWNEFSSRYNFIAVDYLIYTNEVIGNIRESYPVTSILLTAAIIAGCIIFLFRRKITAGIKERFPIVPRLAFMVLFALATLIVALVIPASWKNFSKDNYANELAGNGIYDFVQAFQNNELDFYKYYQTLPDSTAFSIVREQLSAPYSRFVSNDLFNLEREISYPGPEKKMNVVLISVESLSASFMDSFGSIQHLTPCLDSLANKGLLFTNLYASGTRTVRGLEALSLSIPPLPGQSLVKRPGNENLFSLGAVFREKGYTTQYIYGGYGYFDNMNYFFSHNNYDVIDRTAINNKDIHYANIWGVADEDLFTLALRTMDKNYSQHHPFFTQVMTVSNHRPYTYPEGRIDIPPGSRTREGAVKYTDYAIGRFLKEASAKPWFSNTIFVVVADHCASSAGKTALPVTGYHIPMVIYSPGNILPAKVESLTAQIDIVPTILGLLQFNYKTKFFGQDVLNLPADKQRAFISTYQGLGLVVHDTLIVQSPVKQTAIFQADFSTGAAKELKPDDKLTRQAIACYQAAAWLIRNGRYTSK
ncbi:MAG: alkaline phosphatase family protein [Chitinophagaceae bacterium]|nr:MAG: alkaline phosphatase family protein [Chitinophagaceae bacterium]